MRSNHDLRIILYDPSGAGGICHYTYQLAENLARVGSDVTVLTTEDYELRHLRRNFKIQVLYRKSWVKSFIVGLMAQIRGRCLNYRDAKHRQDLADPSSHQTTKIILFLRALRLWLIWLKAIFSLLLKKPDVIHFQWLVSQRQDYYFIKLLKLLGFKIVYTVHDLLPNNTDSPEDRKAFQRIYRLPDKLIVHAESNKKEMICEFNTDPNKIYVVPHGSYDLFYGEKNVSKEVAREVLRIPQGKKVLLFFGIIKRYKGLEYLVDAFGEVKANVANVMLLIVGSIHNGDAEAFKYYSHLVDEIGSRDDVMCIREYVPFDKVGYYFSAADLVVLPYTKTSHSGVLLSAYAAGRPVVVTDTGGLSEVVEDGKTGFVVPPRDAKALAQAIIKTIASPARTEEMGRYAKYLAETTYSWKDVALKTIDVYRSLAASC